jgi:hypothetical protein
MGQHTKALHNVSFCERVWAFEGVFILTSSIELKAARQACLDIFFFILLLLYSQLHGKPNRTD